MKHLIVVILLAGVLFSCGSSKHKSKRYTHKSKTEHVQRKHQPSKAVVEHKDTPAETQETVVPKRINSIEDYVAVYSGIAIEEMRFYNIPASITLAQGILESGSGRGRLAVEANNHFGIKCHDWTGARIYHDDDKNQECFRKYVDAKYSFRDHSLFLTERSRYANLFHLDVHDYKGWAKGLRAAGYATDRKYPEKLIALIERYQLYKYDSEVTGKSFQTVAKNRDIHFVRKGDTLYSISRRYNLSVKELQQINGLTDNTISVGQELYVTPL
ncbi:glucosaminidase domain-containing protein [Formosa sp. S-31]|uniref:glucosaminidase domain-containing protein n=1 Tax=Formosa sp. S-31 TaxID=2790949 RepID=UPI003EBF1D4C